MASLQYYNDSGAGQMQSDNYHYSQAVRIPGTPLVKCAGQGGWEAHDATAIDENDSDGQVERAFQNVENVLRAAGLQGWQDVYLLRTYHTNVAATLPKAGALLQKRCPDHRPLWTVVPVPRLADPRMLIEVEVEAYEKQ